MPESGIILPVDSTGKAQRTLTVTTAFTTGTGGVVHMPVGVIGDPVSGKTARISSFGGIHAVPVHGMVNSTFFTSAALTSNYVITNVGSGTTTANATDGFFTMTTGATASSTSQIVSNDVATYNGLGPMLFLNGLRVGQAGLAGVVRRWGMFSTDGANGYFFEDRDGVLGVVSRKNGVDNRVASTSFNGTIVPIDYNAHIWEIEVTGGRAVFSQDQILLHTIVPAAGTTTTSATLSFIIRVDIANGANAVAYTMEGRGQNIARIGVMDSKRLNEPLLDTQDVEMVRSVPSGRIAADTYAIFNMKAASTAVVAGDQALVVGLHPSSPLPAGTNTIGAITGTGVAGTAATGVITIQGIAGGVAQPVSGTIAVSTLPALVAGTAAIGTVSVTLLPAIPAGANEIGRVRLTDGTNLAAVKAASTATVAADPASVVALSPNSPAYLRSSDFIVSTTGAAGAAVTLTLPAAGVGLFHYITRINILKYASAAVVGVATPVVVTSTNLAGSLAWTTPTAQAIGTQYETDLQPAGPIKSVAANTATTIVCPLTASILWRINVYYYIAP